MNDSRPAKPKRRWYQYSLRSLFVLMTLVAVACGWYAVEMQEASKRRAAIGKITELGGEVWYYDAANTFDAGEPPRWYSWLRKLHGDEHLGNPGFIRFMHTGITDAGLVHLKGVPNLERLCIDETRITDAGLVHLKGLKNLKGLVLANTRITDDGLANLKSLTRLEDLQLHGWGIHDAGLMHLGSLTNLTDLDLGVTLISDAGLAHLEGLTNLEVLDLSDTQITNDAIENLQKALPNCEIY